MFKEFVFRRADPDAGAPPPRQTPVVEQKAKPTDIVPYRKIDDSLRQYLDLKSRLHEELLGRLNLTVSNATANWNVCRCSSAMNAT